MTEWGTTPNMHSGHTVQWSLHYTYHKHESYINLCNTSINQLATAAPQVPIESQISDLLSMQFPIYILCVGTAFHVQHREDILTSK